MIKAYNTQKRQKEELIPAEPNKVKMYVCGPTTYNFIHLGNARPLVVFDVVRRYLAYRGYEVTYVQNFTDVDDKIINRAREEGDEPLTLAARYIQEYFKDADALGVMRADLHPRVSEHIPEIIEMVETLIRKNHAYVVDGDVYFRVSSFDQYGKLSGRSLEDMLSGARVEIDERKESPVDFALWKKAKPGEPSWESPWGPGRPGWHIECSAMSMKYLGATFDIHGGGADLVFPHHENELAQSEAYSGQPFARYWLHNGFITVNKEKMSKSLGNFFIVRDILDQYPAPVVRFYLLATHYRSPLDFDDTKLTEAGRALDRLKNTRTLLDEAIQAGVNRDAGPEEQALSDQLAHLKAAFEEAMDDDFNTALAISHIFEISRAVNSYLGGRDVNREVLTSASTLFDQLIGVLGLSLAAEKDGGGLFHVAAQAAVSVRSQSKQRKDYQTADRIRDLLGRHDIALEDSREGTRLKFSGVNDVDALMRDMMELRSQLRQEKNFAGADLIRETLADAGIVIEDTRDGARWKQK